MPSSPAQQTLRFRDFELDVEAYQLRWQGRPVRLERRPMELLMLLVEHRGRLVSRSQIAERLWAKDVFVDVETGVNIAVSKVRQALRDSAEKPECVAALGRARELDPLNPMSHAMSAVVAFQARDYSAALEHAERATVIGPEFWIGHAQQAQAYEQLGRQDAALDAMARADRLAGGSHMAMAARGYLLATLGRDRAARDVLRTLEQGSREWYVPPSGLALVYAGLGERDRAFEWLEKAFTARDVYLVFLPVDPRWDTLRADPRLAALVARCGFRLDATRERSTERRNPVDRS